MTHPLFVSRPWSTAALPVATGPHGMLGGRETLLFYHLAKDWFSGQGTIVDAGSFLGKSAYWFAQGLRANPNARPGDRVHCFDNFVVNDEGAVGFLRTYLHVEHAVGDSTRAIFETQVAPVRDLLAIHAGDFHVAAWPRQPIEILMVDIAKSESLGRRVVESFFPDLVPGRSLVVQQDYHHPFLPHIHVVMEYLADCFEIVAPRVDSSAVFLLARPLPPERLRRAIAYDFTRDEQEALMDRAVARMPADDRHHVELARAMLYCKHRGARAARTALETILDRHPAAAQDREWVRDLDNVRQSLDETEGWQAREQGDTARALQLADDLIARGSSSKSVMLLRGLALVELGRHGEAETELRGVMMAKPHSGYAYIALAHALFSRGRIDEAEAELVRGICDRGATETRAQHFLEALAELWARHPRPGQRATAMHRLRQEMAREPEVWVLDARLSMQAGQRHEALLQLRRACELGLQPLRRDQVLQLLGLTMAELTAVKGT